MKFNKELFESAGITRTDISKLFKVSRTTVFNWYNDTCVHKLIENRVKLITAAVEKALAAKQFPVTSKSYERQEEILSIIKKYL